MVWGEITRFWSFGPCSYVGNGEPVIRPERAELPSGVSAEFDAVGGAPVRYRGLCRAVLVQPTDLGWNPATPTRSENLTVTQCRVFRKRDPFTCIGFTFNAVRLPHAGTIGTGPCAVFRLLGHPPLAVVGFYAEEESPTEAFCTGHRPRSVSAELWAWYMFG